jgi:uncharacterized protein YgiB involved in biofilm formation
MVDCHRANAFAGVRATADATAFAHAINPHTVPRYTTHRNAIDWCDIGAGACTINHASANTATQRNTIVTSF